MGKNEPTTTTAMMTVGEIAAEMGIGVATVWRWRDAGRMPAPVKIGAVVRWRRDDIDQWIAKSCPDMRGAR